MPNFCFIPADLNKRIGGRPPSEYFASFKGKNENNRMLETALRSHLIPWGPDSPIWSDDYDAFLQQRAQLIWAEILKVLGEGDMYDAGASVPRDDARLAIDEIEVKLRRLLHHVLNSRLGADYWKDAIPPDLQKKIKERINERHRSRVITRIDDPLIRLQYADVMDYHKIIDKNWELFADRFGNREDTKSHFLALKNYRNPLGHARDIGPIERKRGEAAVLWFRQTLAVPVPSVTTSPVELEQIAQDVPA